MLDHHLQRSIVYQLAFQESARFSELKPDDVESKLFTYHLKKVVQTGYVVKAEDGLYSLTAEGRRMSTGARDKEQALIVERAHSVLFLVIRRKSDGAWLLYERGTHPMLGYRGFIHCNPTLKLSASQAAQKECAEKTGLNGNFTPLGGGYVRIFKENMLESFTHFTLLYCDDIQGDLAQNDPKATYFWEQNPDFTDKTTFPSSQHLHDAYVAKQPFFIEETFHI